MDADLPPPGTTGPDQPDDATPGVVSVGYRVKKLLRRHRGPVVAAAVVLLALEAGIIGTTWGLVRADRAWEAAEAAQLAEAERAQGERQAKEQAVATEKLAAERLSQVEAEKKRAETDAQKALEEKRIADAVRDFLQQKLLGHADTRAQADAWLRGEGFSAAAKRDLTVRELLDRAAAELSPEKIEASFPKQPLLQAEILQTVGNTYRGVGEYSLAVPFFQRAARLRQQQLGPDHVGTLTALNSLASAYQDAGKPAEAVVLLEQTHAALETKLSADHPITLGTLHNLAGAYQAAGKLPEAIKLYEQACAGREATLGPEHPHTLRSLHNLAAAYQGAGKHFEAVKVLEQVHAAFEKKFGPEHPETLDSLNGLANAYGVADNLPKAIERLEQTGAGRAATLGADHLDTLTTLHNLAVAYGRTGNLPKAMQLIEKVRAARELKLGSEHPHTLAALAILGVLHGRTGQPDKGISFLEEAYRKGQGHADLQWVGNELLTGYMKTAKTEQASRMIQELLAQARKQLPPQGPQIASALAIYGMQLVELKQYADAEPVLRECVALREKLSKESLAGTSGSVLAPWQVANAKSLLGGALLGQKKYADAEPLLLAGAEELQKEAKAIPPQGMGNIAEAIGRLVELYEATGNTDEAAKWRKQMESRAKP
jgi:eukaryotic-like serine/threonine-protein kinase